MMMSVSVLPGVGVLSVVVLVTHGGIVRDSEAVLRTYVKPSSNEIKVHQSY